MKPQKAPSAGQTIGRYRLVAEVGRGQHAIVYRAWQPSLQRYVALKVLHHYDQQTMAKLQAEARLTAQMIQQGVPHLREVYEVDRADSGHPFVVLEFVEESLAHLLRRSRERKRLMNPAAAAELLKPVARALDAMHQLGWVHLDVKPQNILLTREGRTLLADLGIAQRIGSRTHACTPAYASPEQAAGDRPVGPWSDIYSLGAVLYQMVAGYPPVRGEQDIVLLTQHLEMMPPSPRRVNPQISTGQEQTIFRALAKSPRKRFETADDFLQALTSPDPLRTRVLQTPSRILGKVKPGDRRSSRLALLGGILLLAVLLLLALALAWPRPAAAPTPAPQQIATEMPLPTATQPAIIPMPTATPSPQAAVTGRQARPCSFRFQPPSRGRCPEDGVPSAYLYNKKQGRSHGKNGA
ncbi:MAG: serine/threonine-protein kinase [Anaerolineae bacterium]|jgi:serine/threonine-protein kinase